MVVAVAIRPKVERIRELQRKRKSAEVPTERPPKRQEASLRPELSLQALGRSDLERSIELWWEAIQVAKEHDSGWGPTLVPSPELALVVVEDPTEVLEYLIEVPTSDGVTGAGEELPTEDNREERVVEDEQAKAKKKFRA